MSGTYSAADLRIYTLEQLYALQRQIERELQDSPPGSARRRNALANHETVARLIRQRQADRPYQPRGLRPGP